jgi:hypothetical protein
MSHENERHADLPEWVTEFDSPEVVAAREKPTASRPGRALAQFAKARPALVPSIVGVGGVAGVVAILFAALSRPIAEESGFGATPATPSAHGRATPSPTASVESVSSIIPETCPEAYSEGMVNTLTGAGLELNSVWTGSRGGEGGTADDRLLQLLDDSPALECYWLDKTGGSDSAVLTIIADSTDPEIAAAMDHLAGSGLTRREEYGGIRFFGESTDATGERSGESHFFREGIWFATRWYGYGPFGYSADMAETVFS